MEDEWEEQVSEEDILDMIDYLVATGLIKQVGTASDGTPLYKFSEEILQMPEFEEIHESITNDILFSIWQKGFIEMYPLNEEGDWKIELCDKSYQQDLASSELSEDEYILFLQVFDELSASNEV